MRQRAAIDVFQFAAERHAMRQPARMHLVRTRELGQVMRGGLAFHGRVGGDDQLLHFALGQPLRELVEETGVSADLVEVLAETPGWVTYELPPELLGKTALRPVELLVIAPSERLDAIASRHIGSLPRPIRTMLSGIGAAEARGAALASYLLFESTYTNELIRLGQRDTQARKDDVLAFFGS